MPVCPVCKTFSEEGKAYCTECGTRLTDPLPQIADDKTDWQTRYKQYSGKTDRYEHRPEVRQTPVQAAPSDGGVTAVSIVSLVFGILGFVCLFLPLFSIPGLVTGIIGTVKGKKVMAKIGLILSVISLVFFTIAFIISAINGFDFSAISIKNLVNIR